MIDSVDGEFTNMIKVKFNQVSPSLKDCALWLVEIIIIIWFGDTVTVLHLTKCNTNSKVQAFSA